MTQGGYFEELIPQNTTVPTHRTKIFTTSRDNQTAVKIVVMQGESERAEDNELLGEFILTGCAGPSREGRDRGDLRDQRRRHRERPREGSGDGKEQSIEVTASSGLTRDEIQNMMDGAKDYWSSVARARSSKRPSRRPSARRRDRATPVPAGRADRRDQRLRPRRHRESEGRRRQGASRGAQAGRDGDQERDRGPFAHPSNVQGRRGQNPLRRERGVRADAHVEPNRTPVTETRRSRRRRRAPIGSRSRMSWRWRPRGRNPPRAASHRTRGRAGSSRS
jgi:hypothetical protein